MGKRLVPWRWIPAVASGLMVACLFPPFNVPALAWVSMIPLLAVLWSLQGKRVGLKGFFLGWLAGAASCGVQFFWLSEVSWLGALLLPAYLGLYWGMFAWFAATLGNPLRVSGSKQGGGMRADGTAGLRAAVCNAAVWGGLEWLRGWLFTGFGWNGLGVAFHETRVMAQAADLLGVSGLSMLLVFFQSVMVLAGFRWVIPAAAGARRLHMDVVLAGLAVALTAGYGWFRISTEGRGESVSLKTVLVQLNIPQDAAQVLWSALDVHMGYEQETQNALEAIPSGGSADSGGMSPDWVMWPECALTGRILITKDGTWATSVDNQETIERARNGRRFQLIYGINEMEAEQAEENLLVPMPKGRIWNSLAVTSPDNGLHTYRKHHLVIFGETIPFVDSIPWLKQIYENQAGVEYGGSFTPGDSFEPLPIPTANGTEIATIPTVCFEDSVPRLTRRFVRSGPQVIVNVTNDGWFRESAAAAQHFANARFRSIELRRPMLRCSNTGVSAAVDTTGSTAHPDTGAPQVLTNPSGSHFTRGSILTKLNVPVHPSATLYAMIGDWGVIALSLMGWLWAWISARRNTHNPIMSDAG